MTPVKGSDQKAELSPTAEPRLENRSEHLKNHFPYNSVVPMREGVLDLPGKLPLHLGGNIADVRIAWRLTGASDQPVVLVLGGISAGRKIFALNKNELGWWREVVGPGLALDASRFQILGIDFLGGSGESTGPIVGQKDFPSISAYDQAVVISKLMQALGIGKLHAVVGASYGGMVALSFAERFPQMVERIIVISAADRAHPLSTAWRSVQRATVKQMIALGDGAAGLKIARALAMTTYRSAREFGQRFDSAPINTPQGFRFPVEEYLYARGQAYADSYIPEAFVCLSESIDLHRVDPVNIRVPTTLVAIREDQLVPLADMEALRDSLRCPVQFTEVSSIYGHDAFLKEAATLRVVFAQALA